MQGSFSPKLLVLLLPTLTLLAAPAAQAQETFLGRVVEILDGDHLLLDVNGQLVRFNLAYIRPAVEEGVSWDAAAAAHLAEIAPPGTELLLEPAFSRGETIFGFAHGSDGMLNVQMIEAGVVETPWALPNPIYGNWWSNATETAINAGVGRFASPSVFADNVMAWSLPTLGFGAVVLAGAALLARRKHRGVVQQQPVPKISAKEAQQSLTSAIATQKRLEGEFEQTQTRVDEWLKRAEQALSENNDDLARQALVEKKRYAQKAQELEQSLTQAQQTVNDIRMQLNTLS